MGGLSTHQQKRRLLELSPPERYLELSKPLPAAMSSDFEVMPIGEGILLASSALQILSAITSSSSSYPSSYPSSNPSNPSAPSNPSNTTSNTTSNPSNHTGTSGNTTSQQSSAAPIDSIVLYNSGYVLQLSGTGAFDSMWTPCKDGDEDPGSTRDQLGCPSNSSLLSMNSGVTNYTPGNNGNNAGGVVFNMASKSASLDHNTPSVHSNVPTLTQPVLPLEEYDEFIPTDIEAMRARNELAVQTSSAIQARRFEVSAIAAGALVAAYGCRQSRSAVCWLLQLQR